MEKTIKKTAKSKHNVKTKAIVKNHKTIVKDHEDQVLQMKKLHSKELEVCNSFFVISHHGNN